MEIHPGKCHFLQCKVNFFGRIVSAGGVSPNPSKTSRINEWPIPKTVLEVQQFLGLANCHSYFIKDFATIAKPLHQGMEKKYGFK